VLGIEFGSLLGKFVGLVEGFIGFFDGRQLGLLEGWLDAFGFENWNINNNKRKATIHME